MSDPILSELDPVAIAANEAFLTSFLAEQYPSLDLSEGRVLRNVLLRIAAILRTLDNEDVERLRQSMSLSLIEANPALADEALVDAVLSNFRVTRHEGSKAVGQVTIILTNLLTTTVEAATILTALGLNYTLDNTFVGVTTLAAVISDQQRLIIARNDGTFAFTIPVFAAAVGAEYRVKRGTRFTFSTVPPGFIDAFATSDFTGGTDAQTNEQLIESFKLGISQPVFSGRIQIENLIRSAVAGMEQVSITGLGDPEMLRDRHNIFAVSHGGKADIYSRTQPTPEAKLLTKTATLIDATAKLWQLALTRDDAPGFYSVESILPVGDSQDQSSLEITQETRGLDLTVTDNEFVPDVANLIEGSFSRYQTSVLQFIDPDSPADSTTSSSSSSNSSSTPVTKDYVVRVLYMPQIDTLQDLAVDRGSRNPQADYLVRAPIPAFATVSLRVLFRDGIATPTAEAIQLAVSQRVNDLGFAMGRLSSSVIFDAVHDAIGRSGTMVVSPLDMSARILKPGGGVIDLRSTHELVIPNRPADGISSRTTVFYMDAEDVDVAIEKVSTLPV